MTEVSFTRTQVTKLQMPKVSPQKSESDFRKQACQFADI